MSNPRRILLEGRPGVGKTTAARGLASRLARASIRATGFTTEEVREAGRRVGFAIENLQGDRATLASTRVESPIHVGKYAVDLGALERIALPAMRPSADETVVLIDELGKMELASSRVVERIWALFEGPHPIVATVHAFRHPVTDSLKRREDVEVVGVTRRNRDGLPDWLFARITFRGANP